MSEIDGTTPETVFDLSHLFYDFHNYEVKTKITTRLTWMIVANLVSTLITNPLDVCLSKMATQHYQYRNENESYLKYPSLWKALKQVK
jgi:hypothetical protein